MSNSGTVAQLEMPGMPKASYADVGPADVAPGKEVLYLGRLIGGPRYGSRGVVREVRGRKAIVEIGRVRSGRPSDIWHIPYYFLADPSRAA
jgi:hypothetical protein